MFVFEGHGCVRTFLFPFLPTERQGSNIFLHSAESMLTLKFCNEHPASYCRMCLNIFRYCSKLSFRGAKPLITVSVTLHNICAVSTVMWEDQKILMKSGKQMTVLVRVYSSGWLEPGVRIYLPCAVRK